MGEGKVARGQSAVIVGLMTRFAKPTFLLFAAVAATPAFACDRSPDLMRIPGSTDEAAEHRYESYEQARDILWAHDLETSAINNSWRVYLAKVEKVAPSPANSNRSTVTAKPVWQVRGTLPDEPVNVLEDELTSCPRPGGLWKAKPGDLIVVFGWPSEPTAWRAEDVRSNELIDAIDMYVVSLEKKGG